MGIGDVVMNGLYEIASLPYEEKKDAKDDIAQHWQGVSCRPWYCTKNNEWYIITPV